MNITVNLTLLTRMNTTYSIESFGSLIESLLIKKSKKYDIFFYDNAYTYKFGTYLVDLKPYFSMDFFDSFNTQILQQTCSYKNKLVGLVIIPFFFFFFFLKKIK